MTSSVFRRLCISSVALGALVASANDASAQQPPPQQWPPPQQQPPPGQWPPPQQQPPPGQWQQPPPGQWQQPPPGQWQQPPPQQWPPPQQYPPPGYYPQQPPPPPPPPSDRRAASEMLPLYITGGLYGVGTGIWLDALFKITNPGAAVIFPLTFGAAVPIGIYFWDDQLGPLHRGVPSTTAAGLILGGVEGIAIAGTQWQYEREDDKDWTFQTQTTVTWIMATGGGIGGWAFGEWIRPDPRSMSFILSTAGWGALSGTALGTAVSGRDWKDGASVAGLITYNVGIVAGGAISIIHTPSYNSQKWMWAGYGLGALAGCLVFPFYIGSDSDAKTGFIGPAIGSVAGAGLAGALTFNMKDEMDLPPQQPPPPQAPPGYYPQQPPPGPPRGKLYKPPVNVAFAPVPPLTPPSILSTSAGRSISEMVGPTAALSTPQGTMVTVVGTF